MLAHSNKLCRSPKRCDSWVQPVLKFRNYTPRDEKIEHEKLAPANPKRYEAPPPDEDEEAEAAASEVSCIPNSVSIDSTFLKYTPRNELAQFITFRHTPT